MLKSNLRYYCFLLACIMLSMQSCISRLRRPEITGVIVDYEKKPIANCRVGDVLTDKDGKFKLAEQRYHAFLLTELLVMEAPPLMVLEPIEKEGFEKDDISIYHKFGGGRSKGAKTNLDTIFLRKTNQAFDIAALLKNSSWKLGYTKQADTIYLIKDGFMEWCKTSRCNPIYQEYQSLVDNYYTGAKNLPEGMIRRMIDVHFETENSPLKINMICEYVSTFEGPNRPPDTVNTTGQYQILNNTEIILNTGKIKQLRGNYLISNVDLFQIKLTKAKGY